MFKRFTKHFTVSQINKVFRHAKFSERTHCPRCNSRRISLVSDGRFLCRRCHYLFSLTTNTYLDFSRLSFDQWYELLYWFVYEFTQKETDEEMKLNQKLFHLCFFVIADCFPDYG